MGYYSDPTAAAALGGINREFSRLEKKAKRLRTRLKEGTLSPQALERARTQYTGIYRHVLDRMYLHQNQTVQSGSNCRGNIWCSMSVQSQEPGRGLSESRLQTKAPQ